MTERPPNIEPPEERDASQRAHGEFPEAPHDPIEDFEKAEAAEDIGEVAVDATISGKETAASQDEQYPPTEPAEHIGDRAEEVEDAEPEVVDESSETDGAETVGSTEEVSDTEEDDEEDPAAPPPPTPPTPPPGAGGGGGPGGGGHGGPPPGGGAGGAPGGGPGGGGHGGPPPGGGAGGAPGGGPGGGLPPHLRDEALANHLRLETVERALADGFTNPIEYLIKSRRHPELAKRLERHGYDLTPPPPVRDGPHGEDVPLPDPIAAIGRHGGSIRDQIAEIQRAIETEQGLEDIVDRLQRPAGRLPRGLGLLRHVPVFGRKWGQLSLAVGMFRHERAHRPATREVRLINGVTETVPASYNDGFLRLGLNHIVEFYEYIKRLDQDVLVQRNKLSRMNIHDLRGPYSEGRRDTAERILLDIFKLEALEELEMLPDHFYEHQPYKDAWKAYTESKDSVKRELERFEYIRLKSLGVRTAEEQSRMDELLSKHPGWYNEAVLLRDLGVRTQAQEERLDEILNP